MPIYEYLCPHCGEPFEKLVRGGNKAKQKPVPCPICGKDSYRKEVVLVASTGGTGAGVAADTSCAPSG